MVVTRAPRVGALLACLVSASCASIFGFEDGVLVVDGGLDATRYAEAGGGDAHEMRDAGLDAFTARDAPSESDRDASGQDAGASPPCTSVSDCPEHQACDTAVGSCGTTCGTPATGLCHGGCCGAGTCVSGSAPTACGSRDTCTDCTANPMGAACSAGGCGCNDEKDCPANHACVDHACSTSCAAGQKCNGGCCGTMGGMAGQCVVGTMAMQCGASGETCLSCTGTTGMCSPTGACVACLSAMDCMKGEACVGGTCGTGCSATAPCNGSCCDLTASGGPTCVMSCTSTQCCSSGICTAGTTAAACGNGGGACTDCATTGCMGPQAGMACVDQACGCNSVADCASPCNAGHQQCGARNVCGN